GLILTLGLFSFKNNSGDNNSKTILISIVETRGENDGIVITYGDGTKETRPFKTRVKPVDRDTWVELQSQTATILNEFKEKGYHFAGSHVLINTGFTTMILEKD